MNNPKKNQPYSELGIFLKKFREKNQETLNDVSSAVEIDPNLLEKIEKGQDRPTEDILILLINHFKLKDNEALNVWKLANYDDINLIDSLGVNNNFTKPENIINANLVMVMPFDARPLYSDNFEVIVGPSGLVLNFNQNLPNNQTLPITRIGVSLDQASQIIKSLETALLQAKYNSGPKRLNSPEDQSQK